MIDVHTCKHFIIDMAEGLFAFGLFRLINICVVVVMVVVDFYYCYYYYCYVEVDEFEQFASRMWTVV